MCTHMHYQNTNICRYVGDLFVCRTNLNLSESGSEILRSWEIDPYVKVG